MQNIAEVEKSAIEKMALLNKVAVGGKRPDVNVRKLWLIQKANIRQMAVDVRRPIISWDARKIQRSQKRRWEKIAREIIWDERQVLEQPNSEDNIKQWTRIKKLYLYFFSLKRHIRFTTGK